VWVVESAMNTVSLAVSRRVVHIAMFVNHKRLYQGAIVVVKREFGRNNGIDVGRGHTVSVIFVQQVCMRITPFLELDGMHDV
jgi:hypothetical protein